MNRIRPINVRNPIEITKEIKRIGKQYKKKPKDFRVLQHMTFINDMDCMDALKLLSKTFNLNMSNSYQTTLKNYYIYFRWGCDMFVPVCKLPFNVITDLYNHIYFCQERMGRSMKVNEIEMFAFEGV